MKYQAWSFLASSRKAPCRDLLRLGPHPLAQAQPLQPTRDIPLTQIPTAAGCWLLFVSVVLPHFPEVPFSSEETSNTSVSSCCFLSPGMGSPASSFILLLLLMSCRATRLPCSQTPPPFGLPHRMTVPPPALLRATSGSFSFLLSLLPRLGGGSRPCFLSSLCQKNLLKQAPKSGYSLFSHTSSHILTPGWWISPRTSWFYPSNLPLPHHPLPTFSFHRTPA